MTEYHHVLRYKAVPVENLDKWQIWERNWDTGDWEPSVAFPSHLYAQEFAQQLAVAMEFDAHNYDEQWFCDKFCKEKEG